jgi:hypothetical protein
MATKAGRFEGKSNAGLRATIRRYAADARAAGEDVYEAVYGLRHTVALNAWGVATLAQVAEDYAAEVRS